MAAISSFGERLDKADARLGDLGRGLGKLREAVKGPSGEPKSGEAKTGEPFSPKPSGLTHEDLSAAMRLGEVRSRLSDDSRKHLDGLAEGGLSYAQQLQIAEAMALAGAGAKPDDAPKPPPGRAANAAQQTTRDLPQSKHELAKLRESDHAFYKVIMADNHPFDPTKLKMR